VIRSENFDKMTIQLKEDDSTKDIQPGDDFQKEREPRQFYGGANQQGDLLAAAQSGFGGSGYGCEQGVPTEAALLATLAAFAVSFGLVSSTF
jgi:hypothetical protein